MGIVRHGRQHAEALHEFRRNIRESHAVVARSDHPLATIFLITRRSCGCIKDAKVLEALADQVTLRLSTISPGAGEQHIGLLALQH